MPRQARKKSKSGVYHVMIRGINQQVIFEDEEDCETYLEILKEYRAACEFEIFAYCLMGNHLHLLIQEGPEGLDKLFRRVGAKYVYWYNGKYARVGHLFQDRYKSEPVETDAYFLTVLRYIHQNPVKAKIVSRPENYLWSSYVAYLSDGGHALINKEKIFSLINHEEFISFHEKMEEEKLLEVMELKRRITDAEAKKVILELSGCKTTSEVQALDSMARDKLITALKERDLSIRQISRLTGISFGIVRKS